MDFNLTLKDVNLYKETAFMNLFNSGCGSSMKTLLTGIYYYLLLFCLRYVTSGLKTAGDVDTLFYVFARSVCLIKPLVYTFK